MSVRCEPVLGWSKRAPQRSEGSNHVDFEGYARELRLSTDVPLAYLDGRPFVLNEKQHLALSFGPPVEEALAPLCEHFVSQTERYWRRWVKHCNIPPRYQETVIRSALVLKLLFSERHGSLVAAPTFGLPEIIGGERNWDYRYTWVRDASFSLYALGRLGYTDEASDFMRWITQRCADAEGAGGLQVLYGIDGRQEGGGARLRCVELKTGKVRWTQDRFGCAALLWADGNLLALNEEGELLLIEATPDAYREKARAPVLTTTCRAEIALANGRLYARDNKKLICLDLRK